MRAQGAAQTSVQVNCSSCCRRARELFVCMRTLGPAMGGRSRVGGGEAGAGGDPGGNPGGSSASTGADSGAATVSVGGGGGRVATGGGWLQFARASGLDSRVT